MSQQNQGKVNELENYLRAIDQRLRAVHLVETALAKRARQEAALVQQAIRKANRLERQVTSSETDKGVKDG